MKIVPLIRDGAYTSRDVLKQVLNIASNGIDMEEMGRRMRVLNVLTNLSVDADAMHLEDADHDTLKQAIKSFRFVVADAELYNVLLAARDAAAPPDGTS